MAKLWAKVNGTWASLGAQSKDDVGLGNVENFTHTNSATDGSSSKYATGAAVKQAYDLANQTNGSKIGLGTTQSGPWIIMVDTYGDVSPQGSNFLFESFPSGGSHVITGVEDKGQYPHYYRICYRKIL